LLKHDPGLEASRLRTVLIKAERWRRRDRWRRSLHRLSPRVDRLPLDRPIFVLGIQGGGTTLVSRCLLRHTAAVSMSGNSSYWVATDEIGFVRNRMNRLPKGLWSSAHRFDLEHPLLGTEHASVYGSDSLVDAYRGTAEDATVEDAARFKRLIREHIAVYADDPSHARFVDKTHTYTLKIPYLDQLLAGHDPHFVLVVRNPYTICFRAVRRKPPSWRRVVPYEEQLRLVAQHWVNSNRRALEDGPATGRFLAVRFEDFVRAPEDVIRAVCGLVGLSYDDALVPRAGDTFPFATLPWDRKWFPLHEDEWRGRVGDADAAIIEDECRGLADELGYGRRDDATPVHPAVLRLGGSEPGGAALVA
jgi:plasmid stabilization system protein ParE